MINFCVLKVVFANIFLIASIFLFSGCGIRKPTTTFLSDVDKVGNSIRNSQIKYTFNGLMEFQRQMMGLDNSKIDIKTKGFRIFYPPNEEETTVISVFIAGNFAQIEQRTIHQDLEFIFADLMAKRVPIESLRGTKVFSLKKEIKADQIGTFFDKSGFGVQSIQSPLHLGFKPQIMDPPCYILEILSGGKTRTVKFCDPKRGRSANDDAFFEVIKFFKKEKI